MKRVLAILFLLPASALAQQPAGNSPEGVMVVRPALYAASASAAAEQPATSQRESTPHRRPSMVGYIGNGTIESVVRVRFDAGFSMSAPDRAEFFYAKCGCYRALPKNLPVYDPNAPGPGPAVVTDLDYQQLNVFAEYAANSRLSVFGDLPVRFVQAKAFAPGSGTWAGGNGLSDLRAGVKFGLLSTADRQVTVSLQLAAPTGDPAKGVGTNHWSVEPVLLYQEHPSDRFTIEAQFGDIIPTDGSAGIPTSNSKEFSGNVLYYGVGPSYEVYRRGQMAIAPVVELVGWYVVNGFQTADVADASGTNIVNLKLGTRVLVNGRSSFYVGYGHALTTQDWYDNILRLEYRVGF